MDELLNAVLAFMKDQPTWEGSSTELFEELCKINDRIRVSFKPLSLSRYLKVITGELNEKGVFLERVLRHNNIRNILLICNPAPDAKYETESPEKSISTDVLIRENSRLLKELSRSKEWRSAILDIAKQRIDRIPRPSSIPEPPKITPTSEYEIMNCLFSDCQVGETVTLKDTSGVNVYNFEIFKERVTRYFDKVIKIYSLHKQMYDIPRINLFGLGDYVEGEQIYPGQPFHICLHSLNQILDGSAFLADQVARLSPLVPEVFAIGVGGNHGRASRKRGDLSDDTIFDLLFWKIVALRIENIPNIKWVTSESSAAKFFVEDKLFMIHHGDAVQSWMNIPFYSLDRWSRGQSQASRRFFDYIIVGHHHRSCQFDVGYSRSILNGSFVGGSKLSVDKMGESNYPSQLVFGIRKGVGQTWQYELRLDGRRGLEASPDKFGLLTPHDGGKP